jgi:hypothetical protein
MPSIKTNPIFRDAYGRELHDGDHVLPWWREGQKPINIPTQARDGVIVGRGTRRVFVSFVGGDYYHGPSTFHRVYSQDLMLARTASGQLVMPSSRRTDALLYRDTTGMWILEIMMPPGEREYQVPLGKNYADDPQWRETVEGMADMLINEGGWVAETDYWRYESETKGVRRVVSDIDQTAGWEIPEEALDLAVDNGAAEAGIMLAVVHSWQWLADRVETEFQHPSATAVAAYLRALAAREDAHVVPTSGA